MLCLQKKASSYSNLITYDSKFDILNAFKAVKNILISSEFKGFARPKDWKKDLWDLDLLDPKNNGLQNEDLIVWMRTAALPKFRKL